MREFLRSPSNHSGNGHEKSIVEEAVLVMECHNRKKHNGGVWIYTHPFTFTYLKGDRYRAMIAASFELYLKGLDLHDEWNCRKNPKTTFEKKK